MRRRRRDQCRSDRGSAGAGCWWFFKKFKTCKTVAASVGGYIFDTIKDKCEGAQNN
ncbi:hypothetical protein [Nannocystis pusilla]|uniref:hypothetical protein n=1 Tax=Nannocystis pusilla TaxID=889268 RepID=UPI003B809FC3